MSKIIRLTPEQISECRRAFDEALSCVKLTDGKISFLKTFANPNEKEKATLYFDPLAWRKMQTLIKEFNKEVAWHGVAYRGEDENKHEYFIKDILVYPQEVTGATVNTDQEKYEMWLMQHDDEVFNNIRMQGHSHVNMGVTPSTVDESHQSRILEQLEDDMFYIFLIWNKSGSKFIKIYDLKKNILFETLDVTVEILDDGSGIDEFLANAKEMVKDKYIAPVCYSVTGYNSGGVSTSTYKGSENGNTFAQPVTNPNAPKPLPAIGFTSQYGKNGKRKGKRKKVNVVKPTNSSMFDGYEELYGHRDNCQW